MKKVLLATSRASAMVISSAASADNIGLFLGVSAWDSTPSGAIQDGPDSIDLDQRLGLESDTVNQFYITLEHPIPLIPNVRIQHSGLEVDGGVNSGASFEFDGVIHSANANTVTNFDLTHTDATAYWQMIDTVVGVDVGITARSFDGEVNITSNIGSVGQAASSQAFDVVLPMLYGRVAVKLPLTGLTADVTGNFISFEDDSVSDITARLNYEFRSGLGVDLGYRTFTIDAEDDDLTVDVEFDGVFAGVSFHF